MKSFGIQYPQNARYVSETVNRDLLGEKTRTVRYTTPNGKFSVTKNPSGYSSLEFSEISDRYITQNVRFNVNDEVSSSKVIEVGRKGHKCQSVQTILKDGTYTVERYSDDVLKSGYTYKPESRQFKGVKGFLEKAILWLSTDINGCEKANIAPIARKMIMKIRHF